MFKVNNKDNRMTRDVSIANFEHVIAGWKTSTIFPIDNHSLLNFPTFSNK